MKLDRSVLRHSENVLAKSSADGSVAVLRLDEDRYYLALDGYAAELWRMMDGKKTLGQIQEQLIKKHKLPKERFSRDVRKLVEQLRKERLIRSSASAN